MSETEELKTRIETIRALSGQLRERNRTVKSLEEEMTGPRRNMHGPSGRSITTTF